MIIAFNAYQIGLVKQANPASGLGNLTEVTVVFDQNGQIIDSLGRCDGAQAPDYDGPGLQRIYAMARKHFARRAANDDAKVLAFPRRAA
jgi:hypothetical protein